MQPEVISQMPPVVAQYVESRYPATVLGKIGNNVTSSSISRRPQTNVNTTEEIDDCRLMIDDFELVRQSSIPSASGRAKFKTISFERALPPLLS